MSDEIEDAIESADVKCSLVESARGAQRLFIVWQDADGHWQNGWLGSGVDMIGYVELAKAELLRSFMDEEDET